VKGQRDREIYEQVYEKQAKHSKKVILAVSELEEKLKKD
jgi:hypothetical protein